MFNAINMSSHAVAKNACGGGGAIGAATDLSFCELATSRNIAPQLLVLPGRCYRGWSQPFEILHFMKTTVSIGLYVRTSRPVWSCQSTEALAKWDDVALPALLSLFIRILDNDHNSRCSQPAIASTVPSLGLPLAAWRIAIENCNFKRDSWCLAFAAIVLSNSNKKYERINHIKIHYLYGTSAGKEEKIVLCRKTY